jgi:hypothetical protein
MFDLENIEKNEHYQIPDNYFEELPGRVIQNIKGEQIRRKKFITSAVAAVAVLIVAVGLFFTYNLPEKNSAITQTQQVSTSNSEDNVLESVATEYYSEELAMIDYYQYFEY